MWRLTVLGIGLGASGTLIAGCGAGQTALEAAAETCEIGGIGDDGRSLTLDMEGDEPGTGDLDLGDIVCVLSELDVPDSVITKMDSTTSLDGRQEDEWAGIKGRGSNTRTTDSTWCWSWRDGDRSGRAR